jgi:hypothetical protein
VSREILEKYENFIQNVYGGYVIPRDVKEDKGAEEIHHQRTV